MEHFQLVLYFIVILSLLLNTLKIYRRFGLVPIASEDYGDMTMQFKVVAVARKTDKSTTLFNMKGIAMIISFLDNILCKMSVMSI